MTDDDKNANPEAEFATLLDAYSPAEKTDMQVGDKVKGKIISIGKDSIFIDIGNKIDGIVETAEMLDKDKQLPHKEGDTVELYIVGLNDDEIRLSNAFSGPGSFHLLREAYENTVPVEGKILETCKGGLRVEVLGRKAFCPASQIDINFVETMEDYVGQIHQFLITQVDERDKNIVISRRALLSKELEKSKKQFCTGLQSGEVLNGRITKLMPYGLFVELHPGVDGLVHVSELSWSRVEDPQTFDSLGEPVRVPVLALAPPDGQDHRTALPDGSQNQRRGREGLPAPKHPGWRTQTDALRVAGRQRPGEKCYPARRFEHAWQNHGHPAADHARPHRAHVQAVPGKDLGRGQHDLDLRATDPRVAELYGSG